MIDLLQFNSNSNYSNHLIFNYFLIRLVEIIILYLIIIAILFKIKIVVGFIIEIDIITLTIIIRNLFSEAYFDFINPLFILALAIFKELPFNL